MNVLIAVSKGKRPPKPLRFEAPGMTPAVWRIAERCWHQKATVRPDAKAVLQYLENLANPGMCSQDMFLSEAGDD